ncbi:GNAT family N-acetyltransferase [Pseudomonas anguilliseptica]|uniref:L-amino acid N-acyltransferase YncA n=1 Tax=Pseudomonas anguilliseptica TaxID=53406 RepID=A0A1H5LIC6_PSEAG|nr:GNAT family N-acetyltransferase [Pseudomonas anguilliseptica]SEE76774.1 L-amino acid N-acyltransferase YncA [Pseudomonas anguilliseptica]
MKVAYRIATPDDTAECIALREKTRENAFSVEQLEELGITLDSWKAGISDGSLPGYVSVCEGKIIGYCFGDSHAGEIVVLALLPEYENKGVGKVLLNQMIESFQPLGFERLFLGCSSDPKARSYGFYRHLGWRSTGLFDDAGDEILEYFPNNKVKL